MPKFPRLLFPLLLAGPCCQAGSVDFLEAVNLGPLGITARFGLDRQGNILIAGVASSCTLPAVNSLSSCGALWVAKLDATGGHLVFATYLGGVAPANAELAGVAADAAGNIVIAADTLAHDWPTTNALQPSNNGFRNLYLAKLAPDGSQLVYATYLGGRASDYSASLAVDDSGSAYVLGSAQSLDFPTTPQSLPRVPNSNSIILKLSADGQTLAYASFVPWIWGGPFYGPPYQPLTVDSSGAVVLWPDFVLVTSPEVWTLSPDGSALKRTPFPYSQRYVNPSAFPLPSPGGFLLTGSVMNGFLPVTADAAQPFTGASPYARADGGPQVPVPIPAHMLRNIAVDPENRNSVYAATDAGLFASQDNGWTWSLLVSGAGSAIAVDPFDSSRLYLSSDTTGLLRSTDGGQTWQPIGPLAASIAADPNIPGLIYAAGGSIFHTTNGGDSWDSQNFSPPGIPGYPHNVITSVSSVVVDPTNAGWAYAFASDGCICIGVPLPSTIFRTQDGGTTWKAAVTFFESIGLRGAVDPATGDLWVIAGQAAVLYRGGDFNNKVALNVPPVQAVVFDPANPGTIYLEMADRSISISTDDGQTWTPFTQLLKGVIAAVGAGGVLHVEVPANAQDAYIFLLAQDGTIQYGSYFGGGDLAVNATASAGGQVFIAGSTGPGMLASYSAFQPLFGGGVGDGFVASFDQTGKLTWATYLGGPGGDSINWVLPLSDGSAVVVGTTTDYTGLPSLQPSPLGVSTTFIAHLRP